MLVIIIINIFSTLLSTLDHRYGFQLITNIAALCTLPKDVGPCEALFPRYFYNAVTNQCDKFTYGGCEGNANNFESFWDCRHTCEGELNVFV